MSNIENLVIDQGTDIALKFNVYSDSVAPANKIDLAGVTGIFSISDNYNSLARATVNASMDNTNKIVIVPITPDVTNSISFIGKEYKGVWQLHVTLASGKKYRVMEGEFKLIKKV